MGKYSAALDDDHFFYTITLRSGPEHMAVIKHHWHNVTKKMFKASFDT